MAGHHLNENEQAANGPLPGDHALVEAERRGSASVASPGYYPSLNGAEMCGADRSGCFPFASFGGSFTDANTVFAWKSEDEYQGVTFLCNREPGELFLCGGNLPKPHPPVLPGPYIAKVDATTGRQIWRTYLENANVTDHWIGVNNLNILANGTIVTAWSNQIALLDADTGRILRTGVLPSGEAPPEDSHFKHLTVAPDGTLILKNQTRSAEIREQGTMALMKGVRKGLKMPPSILVAIDGETLEVLDTAQLPELAATPHGITTYDGKIAIYTGATEAAYRHFWDPESETLSQDESWVVSGYLTEGQSTGDAPGIMGDWIVIQTNGIGGKVPSSVVAINQHDPARITSVTPFGPLKRLQASFAPPKTCIDTENDMLYSADAGVGKVAGIRLAQDTGEMTTEFVVEATTLTFQPLIGPSDERVLVLTNMKGDLPLMNALVDVASGKYKEQVTWREAATGRVLAESDFFEPLTFNSLIVPGYGGRMYYPTGSGFYVLQVGPATRSPTTNGAVKMTDTKDVTEQDEVRDFDFETLRGRRYVELFAVGPEWITVYNSIGLSEGPPELWDHLDVDAAAKQLGVEKVVKNGPHWWMADRATLRFGVEETTVGGIGFRTAAKLPAFIAKSGGVEPPQYKVLEAKKEGVNVYAAGEHLYELISPDGQAFVLQSSNIPPEELATLGDRLTPAEGWHSRKRILKEDWEIAMAGKVKVAADELKNIYNLPPQEDEPEQQPGEAKNLDVAIAVFPGPESARQAFDEFSSLVEAGTVRSEGAVLVTRNSEGEMQAQERDIGRFGHKKVVPGIVEAMDENLPPGAAGIIAIYDQAHAADAGRALKNAFTTSVAGLDHVRPKQFKAAMQKAQAQL